MVPVSRSTTGAGFPSVSSPCSATISNSVPRFAIVEASPQDHVNIIYIGARVCPGFTERKKGALLRGDQGRDTIRVVPVFSLFVHDHLRE